MDLYTSIAINVLLRALKDKGQLPKVRAAALKVFKEIGYAFENDPAFVDWAKQYSTARDVK
jgi:hypothetical protein